MSDEKFDIRKWHEKVSSNPLIHEKVYKPILEWGGLTKPSKEQKVVVDLGCGSGELLRLAAEGNPNVLGIGIDWDAKVLGFAKRNLQVAGINATGRRNNLKSGYMERFAAQWKGTKPMVVLLKAAHDTLPLAQDSADIIYFVFGQRLQLPPLKCPKAFRPLVLRKMISCRNMLNVAEAMHALKIGGAAIVSSWHRLSDEEFRQNMENISGKGYFRVGRAENVDGRDIASVILQGRRIKRLEEIFGEAKVFRYELIKTRNTKSIVDDIEQYKKIVKALEKGKFTVLGDDVYVSVGLKHIRL